MSVCGVAKTGKQKAWLEPCEREHRSGVGVELMSKRAAWSAFERFRVVGCPSLTLERESPFLSTVSITVAENAWRWTRSK